MLNDNLPATSDQLRREVVYYCLHPFDASPSDPQNTLFATVKRTPARFYLAAHLGDMLTQPLLDLSKIRF